MSRGIYLACLAVSHELPRRGRRISIRKREAVMQVVSFRNLKMMLPSSPQTQYNSVNEGRLSF